MQPVGACILGGQDSEHTRHRPRRLRIDAFDAGMRVGRAQHYRVRQIVKSKIVEIAASAGKEAQILSTFRLVAND